MAEDKTPRQHSSGEIPVLLKGILCGFFSIMAWLFASSDDVGRGTQIGLEFVSAVSGLVALVWMMAWLNSLAAQFVGTDDDETMLESNSTGDPDSVTDVRLEVREFGCSDEDSEAAFEAVVHEQVRSGDESWLELLLGFFFDILSLFPYVCAVVTMTTMMVVYVTIELAGWIGLRPAREPDMASMLAILMFLLSINFWWRWRSRLTERDGTFLQNIVVPVLFAELAALGICVGVAIVGALVHAIGNGIW